MKKLFIIGNWKSNKTVLETREWVEKMTASNLQIGEGKEVVVCSSYPSLSLLKHLITKENLPIHIGAQDISPFGPGAYTGEVNASQIKEFATYTIIGHSERRKYFKEDDELLGKKVQIALAAGLTPVFCVDSEKTLLPQGVALVAYEPLFAIGSGQADTPEDAEKVAAAIKAKNPNIKAVIYGGSVTAENVQTFTAMPSVDGVLPGGVSLDAEKFTQLINNA